MRRGGCAAIMSGCRRANRLAGPWRTYKMPRSIGQASREQQATASRSKNFAEVRKASRRTMMHQLASHLGAVLLLILLRTKAGSCRITDELRREALDAHNYLRRNVFPEAVGMSRLIWSPSLEALAERAAKTCVFEHNTGAEYMDKGENMYLGGKSNFTEILTMMFLERELYDFENSRCLAGTGEYKGPYGFFSTCGHYLQIVRADMTQVGCSINSCRGADGSTNNLAVCEYESLYKERPYRARKPGEDNCDLCGYEGYATSCDNGMCSVLDIENPVRSSTRRNCLNCGQMQYYGVYDFCMCADNFYGDVCEKKIQSVLPRDFVQSCDKCQQENVRCLNGATPVATDDNTCQCICTDGFSGAYCEVDIEEDRNTLQLYIGGEKRYISYYPVDKALWNSVEHDFLRKFETALSNYCGSGPARAGLSANYPVTTINGSLKVGVHAKCGQQYIAKQQLKDAYRESEKFIGSALNRVGVSVVRLG